MKPTFAQCLVFDWLSEHTGVTCSEAIHAGANGRTIDAMRKRGWLVERFYPNGPRTWELTPAGEEIARLRSLEHP